MRLALLVAFVGPLLFATTTVEARPGKTTAASKLKAKKSKAKPAKPVSRKKVASEAVVIEEETKPVAAKEEAPRRTGASVAQASDDEVPRNEPGKTKR